MSSTTALTVFRVAFGGAMLPYVARCVSGAQQTVANPDSGAFRVQATSRIDAQALAWFVGSPTPAEELALMQLLGASAVIILLGYGLASRIGCLAFAVLQLGNTLRDLNAMNNHDHLYWVIALALAASDAHDKSHAILPRLLSAASGRRLSAAASRRAASLLLALALGVGGAVLLVLRNLGGGIGGWVAPVGMLGVWAMAWRAAADGLLDASPHSAAPGSGGEVRGCGGWLSKLLLCAVYVYATVAKGHEDWLSGRVPAEMLRLGPTRHAFPLLFPHLVTHARLLAWGGLLVDALLAAQLGCSLWRDCRTHSLRHGRGVHDATAGAEPEPAAARGASRQVDLVALVALAAATSFHLANHFLFHLESFPWVRARAARDLHATRTRPATRT